MTSPDQHGQIPPDSSSPGYVEKMVHDCHTILPNWMLEYQNGMQAMSPQEVQVRWATTRVLILCRQVL
jgi:hypothetical protein